MADEIERDARADARMDARGSGDIRRQGVREPQPIEGTSAARRAAGSELGPRREFEAADLARANESRTSGEPATGMGASGTGAGSPVRSGGREASQDEDAGVLNRVRHAWERLRHRQ